MSEKIILKNIGSHAWEHPADRATLTALKQIPELNEIIKKIFKVISDKSLRLMALSSAVRVSSLQFPKINSLLEEACQTLDIHPIPECFVSQDPYMNAGALGIDKPFIILNSAIIEKLDDEELLAVIGHELGHCVSGHAFYFTLLFLILNLTDSLIMQIPFSGIIIQGIKLALMEWYRKSELSADRAGALAVQNKEKTFSLFMKMAGGSKVDQMNLDEFIRQAEEYESGGDIIDSIHKILNILGQTHPFPVIRLYELKKWYDSGEYDRILEGKYPTFSEKKNDFFAEIQDSAKKYRNDIAESNDPLAKAFNEIAGKFEKFGKDTEEFFKELFGN
jgi:Zn-dependent protease with chaperone function